MKLQHATGVHIVRTCGKRIMLKAVSNAGIAGATYGRTKDGKYLFARTGKNILFQALGLPWVLFDDPRLIGYLQLT